MLLALNRRVLGLTLYEDSFQAMRDFAMVRRSDSIDEIWYVEHPAVFTQGMTSRSEHLLDPGDIPVIQTDRGGQVTFHGPGQIVAYLMIDVRRRRLGVRQLVTLVEQAVVNLLADYRIVATGNRQAPGVYVNGAKVAALGLRVHRHSTYHGLSLNVDMDLSPFKRINPCGYQGLEVTSLKKLGVVDALGSVQEKLHYHLATVLDYRYRPSVYVA